MSLLEYLNRTVPDLVKKAVLSFANNDEFMTDLRSKGKVARQGGSHVRINRIISDHSSITSIDGSSLTINFDKKPTLETMTGDWGRLVKPIVLPKLDINRMQSAAEKKAYVDMMSKACIAGMTNKVLRQFYIGNEADVKSIGTLNGYVTSGLTSSGFSAGAIQFAAAGAQTGSYLNATRTSDTVDFTNNWHNQYETGVVGTTALRAIEKAKRVADTFSEDGSKVEWLVCAIESWSKLSDEIRSYPGGGGGPAVVYTTADVKSGKVAQPIDMAAGLKIMTNRFMDAYLGTATFGSKAHIFYGLNPSMVELWVNATCDFRVGKFVDRSETSDQDALAAVVETEIQFAVANLLAQFGVSP